MLHIVPCAEVFQSIIFVHSCSYIVVCFSAFLFNLCCSSRSLFPTRRAFGCSMLVYTGCFSSSCGMLISLFRHRRILPSVLMSACKRVPYFPFVRCACLGFIVVTAFTMAVWRLIRASSGLLVFAAFVGVVGPGRCSGPCLRLCKSALNVWVD